MTARRMLSPDEAWIAAVDMAMRDRARYAESLTREELDAELRAMGCDPAEERAKALAVLAEYGLTGAVPAVDALDREDEPAPESGRGRVVSLVVPRRSGRRAPVWFLAATLAAAGVLAIALLGRAPRVAQHTAVPVAQSDPSRRAAEPSAAAPNPLPITREDLPRYLGELNPAEVFGAAQQACAMEDWDLCRMLLDHAEALDSTYDKSDTVGELRWRILQHGWAAYDPTRSRQ